ncbi:MAG: A24 family peptidase [Sphingomicrobium sp.]
MNLLSAAPSWLAALLYILLVIAAVQDGWRMKISNWISGAIAVGAFVAVALDGPIVGLWQNLTLFVAMLAVGTFLFGRNWMGGGDVKLLAAGALWCDFSSGWKMLVAVALAGGVETILILMARKFRWSEATLARVEFLRPRGGIPYGIAIAAGLILVTWWLRRQQLSFWF